VQAAVAKAAEAADPAERQRLLTAVVGDGGATDVELAGELAETLPELVRRKGLSANVPRVIVVEASPSILAGSSQGLVERARQLLDQLHVDMRTDARITAATQNGLMFKSDEVIRGEVFIWAGGMKGPKVLAASGLPTDHNGRLKVDQYLRVLGYPSASVSRASPPPRLVR
jgi:NADH dehydrogenase